MTRSSARSFLFAVLALWVSSAGAFCGPPLNQNHWGMPVDYRDPNETYKRNIVEKYHFTPEIENLVKGLNGPLPGDIHYTLIQLVSHHRALAAMANWQLKNPNHVRHELDEFFPADCYFERALTFAPNDPLIWMIWGNYVFRLKDYDRAVKIYSRAEELAPEDPEVQYNLGLLNVELKNLDKARDYASRAYAQGYPLRGLRSKLERAGVDLTEAIARAKSELARANAAKAEAARVEAEAADKTSGAATSPAPDIATSDADAAQTPASNPTVSDAPTAAAASRDPPQ